MALGKTLKGLRQKQGINQKGLSAISGVSQATISRIETGRVRQLRSTALKNLAHAFGVTTDFLMGDNEVFVSTVEKHSNITIPGVREDRFRQIADNLDPFVIHEGGRVLYLNKALTEVTGFQREELLGKNGTELIVAPSSRDYAQAMIRALPSDPYRLLMIRKDRSIFPAEITAHDLADSVRLAVIRNITRQCGQEAVERILKSGTEIDSMKDFGNVVRILADELTDMGLPFDAVGVNIIQQDRDRVAIYASCPEAHGYQSFSYTSCLADLLADHAHVRSWVSNWRRGKIWEREASEGFFKQIQESPMGDSYQPGLVIDVPFEQGTLALGITAGHNVRNACLVLVMQNLARALSFVIKYLSPKKGSNQN